MLRILGVKDKNEQFKPERVSIKHCSTWSASYIFIEVMDEMMLKRYAEYLINIHKNNKSVSKLVDKPTEFNFIAIIIFIRLTCIAKWMLQIRQVTAVQHHDN
jgi:hypothetical protein